MIALANRTVAVLRGETTDVYGDPADDNSTPVARGVPASIVEQSRRVFDPSSDRVQIIRFWTGRLPAGTQLQIGDRLQDEQTSDIFAVQSFSKQQHVVHDGEVRVDLAKIDITA